MKDNKINPNRNEDNNGQINNIEVIIQEEFEGGKIYEKGYKRGWIIKVKALEDCKFIGEIAKEFTVKLAKGKNLISKPAKSVKEYLKIEDKGKYGRALVHWFQDKDKLFSSNWESFQLVPVNFRGMWYDEGLKISEEGKIIWWLWGRRQYELLKKKSS